MALSPTTDTRLGNLFVATNNLVNSVRKVLEGEIVLRTKPLSDGSVSRWFEERSDINTNL